MPRRRSSAPTPAQGRRAPTPWRAVLDLAAGALDPKTTARCCGAIAASLGLSEATVKSYVSTVLAKLSAKNRPQAALVAHQVDTW